MYSLAHYVQNSSTSFHSLISIYVMFISYLILCKEYSKDITFVLQMILSKNSRMYKGDLQVKADDKGSKGMTSLSTPVGIAQFHNEV